MGRISISGQVGVSGNVGFPSVTTVPLIDIITNLGLEGNLVYCLDAADPNSYSGTGQTWSDVSGNGNDFFRGETSGSESKDPTFNTSGWWDFGTDQYFSQSSASKLTSIDDCHQNNALCTFFVRMYPKTATSTIFNNNINGSNLNDVGVQWRIRSDGRLEFQAFRPPVNQIALAALSTDTVAIDAWHNIATSIDEATGAGGGFHWADNAYLQISASDTFNATYTSPNTGVATDIPNIGHTSNFIPSQGFASGTKLAAFALWSGVALTKANLDAIGSQMNRFET